MSKTRPSHHVYVLADLAGDRLYDSEPTRNAALQFLLDNYYHSPDWQRAWVDNYMTEERESSRQIKGWLANRQAAKGVAFGATVRVDTAQEKGRFDETSIGVTMGHLERAGARGCTSIEIEWVTNIGHGSISGALSKLHAAGVVVRLHEKR